MSDRRPVYRGRFAPSPTGPLHFGSIIAALGSYLQAKSKNGLWFVRIEDIDIPRIRPGAAENILHTLETLGLHRDGEVIIQSQRAHVYSDILEHLAHQGWIYPCVCTRRETSGRPYAGTCRMGTPVKKKVPSLRLRVNHDLTGFNDAVQGRFQQNLADDVGDFIVRRADGIHAYHLAVVADDHFQGITEVVRGSDLLDATPRQIYLQKLLGYGTPAYCHLPVATDRRGRKISKQNHAPRIDSATGTTVLYQALRFLGQQPPHELANSSSEEVVQWGIRHWNPSTIPRQMTIPV